MCHIVNEIKSGFQINEQLLSNCQALVRSLKSQSQDQKDLGWQ